MACTTKQQTILHTDVSELVEGEEKNVLLEVAAYDEEARKYRRYLAQQEALRQLEGRKTHARALAHRMSFLR